MQTSLKVIVDDDSQMLGAMSILRGAQCLYVDTEGKEIGTTEGQLSLICVGTYVDQTLFIFVFDVGHNQPSLSETVIAPLLDLLASPDIPKIMWDARCDYLEIMDRYKVSMQGILDLQIAELVSHTQPRQETGRHHRGQNRGRGRSGRGHRGRGGHSRGPHNREHSNKERLSTRFGHRNLSEHPVAFKDIQVVTGMQKCLEEASLEVAGKNPEVEAIHRRKGSSMWLTRPLPKKLLDYAAGDITRLAALHCHFCAVGWITTQSSKALMEKSLRYAQTQLERGRQDRDYPFRSSDILPQGILTPLTEKTIQCAGCKRTLSADCYVHQPTEPPLRRQHCNVCFVQAYFNGDHRRVKSLREQVDVWVEVEQVVV